MGPEETDKRGWSKPLHSGWYASQGRYPDARSLGPALKPVRCAHRTVSPWELADVVGFIWVWLAWGL
jgi:hypothetical protein